MAASTYNFTHQKILNSGKQLFLQNGYERTNLRELCKGAGITTGAFYRHFKDKETLFSALVDPALSGLMEKCHNAETKTALSIENDNAESMWKIYSDTLTQFIKYIFANFDSFKLLLNCADGTKYVNFLDDFVEMEVNDTFKMYDIMDSKGIAFKRIPKTKLHILYYAYYSCIFETILHNCSLDEALELGNTLEVFFTAGLKKIHEI